MARQEWLELEASKADGDGDAEGEEKVPALLQMAASQVQHDESLTEVCTFVTSTFCDVVHVFKSCLHVPPQEGGKFLLRFALVWRRPPRQKGKHA